MQFGLIGEHLGHSYSPRIHRRIAGYEYELKELAPHELEGFMKAGAFNGLNVTIPYKKAVIPLLDEVSPVARRIGSVNTVVRRDNKLFGHNTDYDGFCYLAEVAGVSFTDRNVLILGTGGTSLMAQVAAADRGAAKVQVVSRTGSLNYQNVYEQTDVDIIVNTTPVGMFPNRPESILDIKCFPGLYAVLDVVYNPFKTKLVLEAEQAGLKASGGFPMLVQQAIVASEHFTGTHLDPEVGAEVLSELYRELSNVILIGMPGSGKTTIGKELARKTNKEFIDIDEAIERKAGATIPEIFSSGGEQTFRAMEKECIVEAAQRRACVIAPGGGAVLDEENIDWLAGNGRVYYIDRSVDVLSLEGRPLSKSREEVEKLYLARLPLYLRYSNKRVENNRGINEAVHEIEKDFNEAFSY